MRITEINVDETRRLAEQRANDAKQNATNKAKKLMEEASLKKKLLSEKRIKMSEAKDQRRAEICATNLIMAEISRRSFMKTLENMNNMDRIDCDENLDEGMHP